MSFDPPAQPPVYLPPAATPPRRSSGGFVFAVVGIALAALLGLLVLGYLALALGASTLVVGTLLALIPLAIVLLAVRWIDRWEPEPRWALWFAFLWGAAVSVAVALVVDLGIQLAAAVATPGGAADEVAQAVVQAPIVEETAKGVGVLLVYLFSRSHFDGPVDGLVYAATVAAGFAFTENILYFGVSLAEGGAGELGATFVVRGLFSPFAHVLFTACTGLALGIAAARGGGAWRTAWCFTAGLALAIALHALWNGSLAFADALAMYVTVQVPIFVGAILLTVFLRRQEVQVTRRRLAEYAAAGWFDAGEVAGLSTGAGRRAALAWARTQRPPRTAAVRSFIVHATKLAFTRNVIATGRADVRRLADEQALLEQIVADRRAIMG